MKALQLRPRPGIEGQKKLQERFRKLETLLACLRNRQIPAAIEDELDAHIKELNALSDDHQKLKKKVSQTHKRLLRLLEKKLKWVPKHHYRTMWTGIGMAVFGIPLGAAFGLSLGNMAFLGIGIPIGLGIGIAIGTAMDARAAKEGRQLEVDLG
jgi:hypothetical protein